MQSEGIDMGAPMVANIQGNTARFTLSGRLDVSNAPQLIEELKHLAGRQIQTVEFDLANLEYVSSAGLRALIFAKRSLGQATEVKVLNPQPSVAKVIRMTGFDGFLTITP